MSTEVLDVYFPIRERYIASAAILIGVFMAALDSSIVNIALPSLASTLHVDGAEAIWITNAYQTSSAATMLVCAALGAAVGERKFYTLGLVLFVTASLGCALSPNFECIVAMRVFQGISYAMMISVGLGLYRVIFPPSSLGTVFGLNALAFAVGTAVGPSLGGLIIAYTSWPMIFYINIPLGVIALLCSVTSLGWGKFTAPTAFDIPGAVTSALAVGLLVIGVDQIGRWPNDWICILVTTSVVLIAIFFKIQSRSRCPLLPLDMFSSNRYTFAVISSVVMFIAQGMALVAIPFVLQHIYRYSVLESALVFTPWPIAVAICAPIAGHLSAKIDATKISTAGVAVFAIGLATLAVPSRDGSVLDLTWRVALCGVGYGFFLPPNNKEMFASVQKSRSTAASGVLSTARTLGQSIGAAIVALTLVLVSAFSGENNPLFDTYVFATASVIALGSSLASLARLRR